MVTFIDRYAEFYKVSGSLLWITAESSAQDRASSTLAPHINSLK